MSLDFADINLVLLFFLTPPTLIPYFDRLHSMMLFWLRRESPLSECTCNADEASQRADRFAHQSTPSGKGVNAARSCSSVSLCASFYLLLTCIRHGCVHDHPSGVHCPHRSPYSLPQRHQNHARLGALRLSHLNALNALIHDFGIVLHFSTLSGQ